MRALPLVLGLLLALPVAASAVPGRDLFLRTWTAMDPRSHGADGLGPTFNARSCAACHDQGGVGGGGPRARNARERTGSGSRNPPALFGAGLIDAVPDAVILAAAAERPDDGAISGRAAVVPGGVGRFGWRGEVARLDAFVAQACQGELGLSVPDGDRGPYDLDHAELADLTAFVAGLPRPPLPDADPVGAGVFARAGCDGCHLPRLGALEGAYTDLLLHDLGAALGSRGQSYYASRELLVDARGFLQATPTEWRTPPLWGLADSAPYLHDGRAATIDEAIKAHGGEAHNAASSYTRMVVADREALLGFLAAQLGPG